MTATADRALPRRTDDQRCIDDDGAGRPGGGRQVWLGMPGRAKPWTLEELLKLDSQSGADGWDLVKCEPLFHGPDGGPRRYTASELLELMREARMCPDRDGRGEPTREPTALFAMELCPACCCHGAIVDGVHHGCPRS